MWRRYCTVSHYVRGPWMWTVDVVRRGWVPQRGHGCCVAIYSIDDGSRWLCVLHVWCCDVTPDDYNRPPPFQGVSSLQGWHVVIDHRESHVHADVGPDDGGGDAMNSQLVRAGCRGSCAARARHDGGVSCAFRAAANKRMDMDWPPPNGTCSLSSFSSSFLTTIGVQPSNELGVGSGLTPSIKQ